MNDEQGKRAGFRKGRLQGPQDCRTPAGTRKAGAAEEELDAYVVIAKQVGLDFTVEEIAAVIEERAQEQLAKTEASIAKLEKLPDENFSQIVGGKGDPDCKDTFKNKENCWHNDGCDVVYHYYDTYICKRIDWCPGGYDL